MTELAFTLAGESMLALAARALFWPRSRTLFVADVHFGKDATFRHALRWVPPGTTSDDLARLSLLVQKHEARRLVILGDAFHSEHAREDATFQQLADWRKNLPAEILMVPGNHDTRATDLARRLDFEILDEAHSMPPWILRHHPSEKTEPYALCGHLHPVVSAYGPARQSLRVPCFWAGPRQCVLPAFGGFTGGATVRPAPGDRVFLIAGDKILEKPTSSPTRPSAAASPPAKPR